MSASDGSGINESVDTVSTGEAANGASGVWIGEFITGVVGPRSISICLNPDEVCVTSSADFSGGVGAESPLIDPLVGCAEGVGNALSIPNDIFRDDRSPRSRSLVLMLVIPALGNGTGDGAGENIVDVLVGVALGVRGSVFSLITVSSIAFGVPTPFKEESLS